FITVLHTLSLHDALPICFPEIGGMKNRGSAPSGICNWRLENWFSLMKVKGPGSWMGYMTETVISSGARDLTKGQLSTLSFQRDQDRKSTRLNSSHVAISY